MTNKFNTWLTNKFLKLNNKIFHLCYQKKKNSHNEYRSTLIVFFDHDVRI